MNEIHMKRLFFALWPDDMIRQQCVKITRAINNGKIRPVNPANLHVTLLFLGNITTDKEIAFREEVAIIPVPKITLRFDHLNFWKKPGVLCLTATDNSPKLMALVDNLAIVARKLDIPIDERPFKPHVTLAKKAKEPMTLEFEPIIWHSKSFCLVESCPLSNGVEYRIIEQWVAK
ncbi:RNA 2',3'-cyclic phosphodiesterase [Methyloglobulus sp.]|uniref:RNA 2',3'-cyclic phosphodiesterase n=1 Tax=Methyloglobulus sp. TaxID=2518622 RepID=UPI003989445C